jgi:hypothetical protein
MFTALIWAVVVIVAVAMWYAYAGSRDVFHPLIFIGPMMVFMYAWMPAKLDAVGGLDGFFQRDQLDYVQFLNVCGIASFVLGCLSVGCRLPPTRPSRPNTSPSVLVLCGGLLGSIGLVAWVVTVAHGTGGDLTGYRGGWDDNGYVRDATLLMLTAFLLILSASFQQGFRIINVCLMFEFIAPWLIEAVLSARRGPTFMIAVIFAMGWYMNRQKRPSLLVTGVGGLILGFLMLFLVSNRKNIYLGSDREMTTEVTSMIEKPDTGNEYIYGAGTIISAEQRKRFYWGRRYLAQVLIRPIPHTVWPNKYEDFGVPELQHNAGTGEGFSETLGWEGAPGSAPGMIADLWTEFYWLNIPVLYFLGAFYAKVWRKAQLAGGPWVTQYIIMAALSIYFVMQTMEAVIFRLLIFSLPMWLSWRMARKNDAFGAVSEFESPQVLVT